MSDFPSNQALLYHLKSLHLMFATRLNVENDFFFFFKLHKVFAKNYFRK